MKKKKTKEKDKDKAASKKIKLSKSPNGKNQNLSTDINKKNDSLLKPQIANLPDLKDEGTNKLQVENRMKQKQDFLKINTNTEEQKEMTDKKKLVIHKRNIYQQK